MQNTFASTATRAVIAPRATTAATRVDRKTIDRKAGILVKTGMRMGLETRSA